MARLYEYQSKEILKKYKIPVPEGKVANTPEEVKKIAEELGGKVVLKVQVWEKGRAGFGGIKFAESPDDAYEKSKSMFGMKVKNFVVEKLLVEKALDIDKEMFAGFIIDDTAQMPLLVFASVGGTGIEEIAKEHPDKIAKFHIDVQKGLRDFEAREVLKSVGITGKLLLKLGDVLTKMYKAMREYDARSLEVNPLVITKDGAVFAADCHISVDDYGVYRHPDLGIEIAREFDRPPTELEKIAYNVEKNDYRGTFYFLQMVEEVPPTGEYIGFHGAGGGGSMMSMDAVHSEGFKIANFTDTSGNPPSSKVYRAAKIILSQPNISGYFASGSGVASQEQFHSARGLVKAFLEEELDIPAVIRLGGNAEEIAIEILEKYLKDLPVKVEGYGKDDAPMDCAKRLKELVKENEGKLHKVKPIEDFVPPEGAYKIETITGEIYIDHNLCKDCDDKPCVPACKYDVLKLEDGKPVLNITEEEAKKGKCIECLACELACKFEGKGALRIHLPIPGLKEYRDKIIKEGK